MRIPTLLAATLLAFPAYAANITDISDAVDGEKRLEVDFAIGLSHSTRKGKITREWNQKCDVEGYPHCPSGTPADHNGAVFDVTELRVEDVTDTMDLRLTFGLWHDLEVHLGAPYTLGESRSWVFASVADSNGISTQVTDANSTFRGLQKLDVNGLAGNSQPLISVPGQTYRSGFGDPYIGFSWAPFNHEREPRQPGDAFPDFRQTSTWAFGLDYTMPIATVDDPAKWRFTTEDFTFVDPNDANRAKNHWNLISSSGSSGMGHGAHILDLWTAASKRMAFVDPFVKLHFTLPLAVTTAAADACTLLTSNPQLANTQLNDQAKKNCAAPHGDGLGNWAGKTGYAPSFTGGLTLGTEIVALEREEYHLKIAFDLNLDTSYVSRGRNYSELSDALGKLTYTDQYLALKGSAGILARFSRYIQLRVNIFGGFETPHFITGEPPGHDLAPFNGQVDFATPEQSPVYDFRIDPNGRRARVEETTVLGIGGSLAASFY